MATEIDLGLPDGRTLHVYDTGPGDKGRGRLAVFWQHGTPNLGEPPIPLRPAGDRLGIRWVSFDRPGYGPSTPQPGRRLASGARDTASVADALGIRRFAVMGHSGGGSYALACAALLPERVLAAVGIATLAPFGAPGMDWFAGMAPAAEAGLRAAVEGREAREHQLAAAEYDPEVFTAADHAVLKAEWAWLDSVAARASAAGPAGQVEDDVAYVSPWGCDPAQVIAPTLLAHGGQDRIAPIGHARWLAERCPGAELWVRPDDGHLSVLTCAEEALTWLVGRTT